MSLRDQSEKNDPARRSVAREPASGENTGDVVALAPGDPAAFAVRRMVEPDWLTASTATDRAPFSPFRIRPNMTYPPAIVSHNAEVERDMLTAYERKLLTSYLANIASGLKTPGSGNPGVDRLDWR